MFNSIKPDQNSQVTLVQQCLANYDYSNATALAEDLLLQHDSEENKGLLADCYLSQQENIKAYFLLKHSTSPLNLYKFAIACLRLNTFTEAEKALLRGNPIPNGVHGIELLGRIYKKQGRLQEAKETYRKALQKNPNLLSTKKKLDKLSGGFNKFGVRNEVVQEVKQEAPAEKNNLFGKPWPSVQNKTASTGLFERKVAADLLELLKAKINNDEPKLSDFDSLAENFRKKVLKEEGQDKRRNDLFGTGTNNQWKSTVFKLDEPPSAEKSYEIVDLDVEEESPIITIEKKSTKKKSVKAVDKFFDEEDCEVYIGDDGKFYSKILNQANIMANNNKFYVVQILESMKERGTFFFWTRWGRVGAQGQSKKVKVENLEEAIRMFDQKVHDKTVKGHYVEIKMEEDPKETIGKSEISRGKFDKKLAEEREKKKISPVLIIEKEQTKKKSVEAVDMYFDEEDCEVYTGEDGKVYSKKLNQTNLAMNNNKYYILQLLESIKERGKQLTERLLKRSIGTFFFWTRWGRVGAKGESDKIKVENVEEAIKMFDQKVEEKTVQGDYLEIKMRYEAVPKQTISEKLVDLSRGEKQKKEESPILVVEKEQPKKNNKKSVKAVDMYFDEEDCEVYTGDDGKFYSAILNQSNIAANNNKFYIVQLLESMKERGNEGIDILLKFRIGTFFFWTRWGRVGAQGSSNKVKVENLEEAIKMFKQKVEEKVVKGPYTEIEIEYEEGPEETIVKSDKKSELPEKLQDLLKLIFDEKMMTGLVKQSGFDAQKLPLGKLTGAQIRKGYEILKEISNAIEQKGSVDTFNQYSAEFYTVIPHDFGFQKMTLFVIDTEMKVQEKLELLATLENIRVAIAIFSNPDSDLPLLDAYYQKLNCKLTCYDEKSDDFAMINEYMKNTYVGTHSAFTLEVQDIFGVERQGEAENYLKDLGNKQLLWFGSRLNNYAGILSQGLKLPPAEAPDNSYMFGKGVYFTDMASKAANYCFAHQGDNEGILLLCEVALGECNEKFAADFNAANLPVNKQSVKGVGRSEPAASGSKIIDNEVVVPMGKPVSKIVEKGCLLHNEYVVYDTRQIKIRYLVKVKFNSKFGY